MQTAEAQEVPKQSLESQSAPEGCGGMSAEPQQEHHWLQKLVGDWTCEGEAVMEPGKPPVHWKATESVRSLGGIWTVGEGTSEMPNGGTSTSIMTLGYDPQKKRFVGTFVASMMTNLWIYDGALDAGGTVLTLDAEGPSMTGDGSIGKYQDIIEFQGEDQRTLRSQVLGPDGQWHQFMTATYTRKK